MDELKDRGKRVMNEVKEDIIKHWDEKSRDFIETFLLLFGRDRLSTIWNESKGRIMQAFSPPGSPHGSENGDVDNYYYDEDDEDDNDNDEAEARNLKRTNKLTKIKHNINKNINHLNNNINNSDSEDDDDNDDEYCEAELSDDNILDSPPLKRSLKLSVGGMVNGNASSSSTNTNTSTIITTSKTLPKDQEHLINSVIDNERPSL